tara:strand:- start:204 stop:458 length:255 start_codon:yes stop_codon:yes gene_type:complete
LVTTQIKDLRHLSLQETQITAHWLNDADLALRKPFGSSSLYNLRQQNPIVTRKLPYFSLKYLSNQEILNIHKLYYLNFYYKLDP